MSDSMLRDAERELERRPGDLDAGARVLRERLRLGLIDHERLAVAALCGSAEARIVSGTLEAGTIPALCQALADGAGKETCVRAALLAAEHAFDVIGPWNSDPLRWWERLSLDSIARWLDDPTDERAAEAEGVAQDGRRDRGLPEDDAEWWGRPAMLLALRPPESLRGMVVARGETAWAFFLRLSMEASADAMVGTPWPDRLMWASRIQPLHVSVLAAVKAGLRDWAMGPAT